MIVWSVAFNIAYKDDTILSVEAVQDKAGLRMVMGTLGQLKKAKKLPKFAEFLSSLGLEAASELPADVASYDFRFTATATNGYTYVCGSNDKLGGSNIASDAEIFDKLKEDVGFNRMFSTELVILTNTDYVDYNPGDESAEASNLIESIESFGKSVAMFTDVSLSGLQTAIGTATHLLIPELENFEGDGSEIFDPVAAEYIRNFVSSGGQLLTFYNTESMLEMVNSLFTWSISEGSEGSGIYTKTSEADDYGYKEIPDSVVSQNATQGINFNTLPAGSVAIYKENPNSCALTIMPYGMGQVVMFGWDWYDAQPEGEQNGSWLSLLDIATD